MSFFTAFYRHRRVAPSVGSCIVSQGSIMAAAPGRVATAGAYVVAGSAGHRAVFMVGLPGSAADRLGVARLGGHRGPGETAWQRAAREVLEEASVTLQPIAPPAAQACHSFHERQCTAQ
jgi:8-oxo-dGTP pyrophosphatase MutT (NUDIX family)